MSTGQPEGTRVALPPAPATAPAASAPAPAAPTPSPAPAPPPPEPEPEEDLLRDVLDELDKERTKRAQAEADVRQLATDVQRLQTQLTQAQQQQKPKEQQQDESQIISRHAFVAMEAQVAGFQQIINALTLGKPAISAAAKQQHSKSRSHHPHPRHPPATLPLHVVRLLEVLPWDPRTAEHIFGKEIIYEWQIYDAHSGGGGGGTNGNGRWHSNIRHFPSRLKQ